MKYDIGDEVVVEIPNEKDPDHCYHGEIGEVIDILEDDLSDITEDTKDDYLYTVELENDVSHGFRYSDLSKIE